MVDFRYHLVSLISVFLALAVGIILGAGPLQAQLGSVLTDQVVNLRDSNNSLKAENDTLKATVKAQDKAFAELSPTMLSGTLTGRTIALVRSVDVSDVDYQSVLDSLKQTGATLGTDVTLTTTWTDAEQSPYRKAFAEQIATYVPGADAAGDEQVLLVTALKQLLRAGTGDANNATLFELFTKSDTPLLKAAGALSGAADAVVFLVPDLTAPAPTQDKNADAEAAAKVKNARDLYVKIATMLGDSGATIVAGAANSPEDTVTALRAGATKVTTADYPQTALGSLNVALAVGNAVSGKQVHLGTGDGASVALGTAVKAPKETKPEGAEGADAAGAQ